MKPMSKDEFDAAFFSHMLWRMGTAYKGGEKAERMTLVGRDLRGVDPGGRDLRDAVFINCYFGGRYRSSYSGLMERCGFEYAILRGARFEDCKFEDVSFFQADVEDLTIRGSLDGADLSGARGWMYHVPAQD